MERAQAALGPALAGLILDFFDPLTPGVVGLFVGPLVGFLMGYCLSGFSRLWLAVPMTLMLAVVTLIGALAHFRDPKSRQRGS